MLSVVRGSYRAPSRLVEGYPPALERAIRKALEVSPVRRFGSAAALAEALERVAIEQRWVGGPGAIQRLMGRLFASYGDSPERPGEPTAQAEPQLSLAGDAPVTELGPIFALPAAADPTRPARPLASVTAHDCDDDGPTRGRARLRRSTRLARLAG
jgi:hypothetical protein